MHSIAEATTAKMSAWDTVVYMLSKKDKLFFGGTPYNQVQTYQPFCTHPYTILVL
jgi:hypothetical protein